MSKSLPISKTLSFQYNIEIVDLHLRQKALKDGISIKIPQSLIQVDTEVTPDQSIVISNIANAFILNSWSPILLDITKTTTLTDVQCNGLFVLYGKLEQVVIKANVPTRVRYLVV